MRSPAAAIAWEFRRRHRWGLLALTSYLLALATIKYLILKPGQAVNFENTESFALVVVVPITATFMYFLAVFTFGLAGDLAARQSMYPSRMFTLPLSSSALAGWPMLDGTAAMAILWLATRLLAVWPSGFDIPMIWPGLLAASLLAWTQALTWMSYPLRGLRVIVTVLWLALIDAVVLIALHFQAREGVMLAILAPHVPLAYLAARFAVARARRGEVPDWRGVFARLETIANVLPRRREPFRSPARAQAWFEWRHHGRALPAMVALVLPFELSLLWVFSETPAIVFETLVAALLTPPFMAAFVAATVSRSNAHGSDSYGVTPLLATRPMTSASLTAAKLQATMWSTAAAWLLLIVAIPVAMRLSGTLPLVADWTRHLIGVVGTPRAIVILLLGFMGLLVSTWKQLVQNLYIGLTGQERLIKASVFVALAFLAILGPALSWIGRNHTMQVRIWNSLPWLAAVLICLKLSAAGRAAFGLHDRHLLSARTLLLGALCWDVAVFALFGLLAWLIPSMIVPRYILVQMAILSVPLARLAAATLALAGNRHR